MTIFIQEHEVVIHTQHGGFSISEALYKELEKLGCTWLDELTRDGSAFQLEDESKVRMDQTLIQAIKNIQQGFNKPCAAVDFQALNLQRKELLRNLTVVKVEVSLCIDSYDGMERVEVIGGELPMS